MHGKHDITLSVATYWNIMKVVLLSALLACMMIHASHGYARIYEEDEPLELGKT